MTTCPVCGKGEYEDVPEPTKRRWLQRLPISHLACVEKLATQMDLVRASFDLHYPGFGDPFRLRERYDELVTELAALKRRIKEANEWLDLEDPCVDFPLAVRELAEELKAGAVSRETLIATECERDQALAALEAEQHYTDSYIKKLHKAEGARLKLECCGNCGHYEWSAYDSLLCGANEPGGLDDLEVEPHDNCKWTPTRWTVRKEGD